MLAQLANVLFLSFLFYFPFSGFVVGGGGGGGDGGILLFSFFVQPYLRQTS